MYKIILINLIITLFYFAIFLNSGFRESGGDMFIIIMTQITALIHLMVIVIFSIIVKKRTVSYWGIIGLILGLIVSYMIFKFVELFIIS
jgi:hypothetical protein